MALTGGGATVVLFASVRSLGFEIPCEVRDGLVRTNNWTAGADVWRDGQSRLEWTHRGASIAGGVC